MINKNLNNFYDVSLVLNEDIYMVALLLATLKSNISIQIVRDLEKHRLDKYEKELELLNDMSIQTLKSLYKVLSFKSIEFQERNNAFLCS
jgi:hypothetical protein